MKKILPILATRAVCACILSCSRDGNLSAALDLAGDNRAELEKVLSHYSGQPKKLQAAEWLVSNMPGHSSVGGDAVCAFCDSVMRRAMTKGGGGFPMEGNLGFFPETGKPHRPPVRVRRIPNR